MSNRSPQEKVTTNSMRPRLGQSVKDLVMRKSSNRNSELQFLASQFDVVKIKLMQFIEALKEQYKAIVLNSKTRLLVAEKAAALAVDSPLSEYAGTISTEERDDVTMTNLNTYLDIHRNLNIRRKMYTDRFLEHIIQYSVEWYSVASRKVDTYLKKADRLRKELDHYESKVNRLHFDKGRVAKSGTGTDAYLNINSKLERNEHKMKSSREAYESCTEETSALIEELTSRCWQDLFPVLLKLMQFDASLVSDEQILLKNLNAVSKCLGDIKEEHKLNPETRLQNIENFESYFHLERSSDRVFIDLSSAEENRDIIISGVQDTLRSNNNSQQTPLANNVHKSNSAEFPEIVTPRIRSFSGSVASGPKIEVDLSYDRNAANSVKHSTAPKNGGKHLQSSRPSKSGREGRSQSTKCGIKRSDIPPKSRAFTGRARDQNKTGAGLKYRISRPKYEGSVAGTSFGGSQYGESHFDPFHDIDDESHKYPLTPVARYE